VIAFIVAVTSSTLKNEISMRTQLLSKLRIDLGDQYRSFALFYVRGKLIFM
jgi:hypothetical protein